MRWVTRKFAKVDRIACPWLIKKFVDPAAAFVFLPPDTDWQAISDGIVFDVPGCALGHHGAECSFDAIMKKYRLTDPALVELAKIVRAAGHRGPVVGGGRHRPGRHCGWLPPHRAG